ncbi:MAG: hypothetical protein NT080_06690 [Spirochaetes bacterium]|nr:hypothetical protein [Spirochaetota bacterium]
MSKVRVALAAIVLVFAVSGCSRVEAAPVANTSAMKASSLPKDSSRCSKRAE